MKSYNHIILIILLGVLLPGCSDTNKAKLKSLFVEEWNKTTLTVLEEKFPLDSLRMEFLSYSPLIMDEGMVIHNFNEQLMYMLSFRELAIDSLSKSIDLKEIDTLYVQEHIGYYFSYEYEIIYEFFIGSRYFYYSIDPLSGTFLQQDERDEISHFDNILNKDSFFSINPECSWVTTLSMVTKIERNYDHTLSYNIINIYFN